VRAKSRAGRPRGKFPCVLQSHFAAALAVAFRGRGMSSTNQDRLPAPAGGLPMALAWQRKASAWLSAAWPVQVVLAQGGPRRCSGLDFSSPKPLADQVGVKGLHPRLLPAGANRHDPAVALEFGRQGLGADVRPGCAAFCGRGVVRWRSQQQLAQGPFVEPKASTTAAAIAPGSPPAVRARRLGRLAECGLAAERMAVRQIAQRGAAGQAPGLPRQTA